jgi:hypothetical protein
MTQYFTRIRRLVAMRLQTRIHYQAETASPLGYG